MEYPYSAAVFVYYRVGRTLNPENTPKNTLLRAVKNNSSDMEKEKAVREYDAFLEFLLGEGKDGYLNF